MQAVRMHDRVRRAEGLMLEGFSKSDIALTLGVSWGTVAKYEKQIDERRQRECPEEYEEKRRMLVAMQMELVRKLNVGWHRSERNEETIVTKHEVEPCPACNGGGFVGKKWCPACGGDGELMVEVVTRTVKGQCGDPAYLVAAREGLKEVAKLLGVPVKLPKKEGDLHLELHATVVNSYDGAPREKMLAVMVAIDELDRSVEAQQKVIGVESVEVDGETNGGE